jgi:multiple sugar transport system substrate-binding protein
MRRCAFILGTLITISPLGASAADLVVWWEKGFYPQEDQAVREIVAAFEQKTGKQVELIQPSQDEMFDKVQAALEAGHPPDFLFGTLDERWAAKLAYDDRLIDLEDVLGPVRGLFDGDIL